MLAPELVLGWPAAASYGWPAAWVSEALGAGWASGDAIGIVGMESGCVKAAGAMVGCVMIGVSCGVVGCANCCIWSGWGFPMRVKKLS